MQKSILRTSALLLMVGAVQLVSGQMNRTLETKVADALAQLPATNLSHSNKVMEEILELDEEGILQFSDMLVPLGTGDDSQARYAIHSLAVYVGGKEATIAPNIVENALLKALELATNDEIKTFLIERLAFCATDKSVKPLSRYLPHNTLYQPVLGTLTTIGTTAAAQEVLGAAKKGTIKDQAAFIEALGKSKAILALDFLQQSAMSEDIVVRKKALKALANMAAPNSMELLVAAAEKAQFKEEPSKAVVSLIQYGRQLCASGNPALCEKIGKLLLDHCTTKAQLHFRSAGIHMLRSAKGEASTKTLIKEVRNADHKYRGAVLEAASEGLTPDEVVKWVKAYKKASVAAKPQIIRTLQNRKEAIVWEKCILPALANENKGVRVAGIKALAYQDKAKAMSNLVQALQNASSDKEYEALQATLLRVCEAKDSKTLADKLNTLGNRGKEVLINVLAARNATMAFPAVAGLIGTVNGDLKTSAYRALSSMATAENLPKLMEFLGKEPLDENIGHLQNAIVSVLDPSDNDQSEKILTAYRAALDKTKVLPILPALGSKKALEEVTKALDSGTEIEKKVALNALGSWGNKEALPHLYGIVSTTGNTELRATAFNYYLAQNAKATDSDDQKLLRVKKLMPLTKGNAEKKKIIGSLRRIKTFLSLVYVSEYLKEESLRTVASNTAIAIALPTPGKKNALSGTLVREIVTKSIDNLSGPDSQYLKIDVKEFLDQMPEEEGFVSLFNGKDLTGWEGLVKNPIARGTMSKRTLDREQAKANAQMMKDWFVKDGSIGFQGEGYNNICTIKDYGDFEMLVDWKITNGGDSGIYLRGTPQVQIWDIARVDAGAQVGSGGLYNNQKNESKPLTVADNPINEWNTFRIKMVGDRVTVHLNGILVTDNVVLENYWDRSQGIFPKEAIELQAHGEDLGFRNIYVREIPSGDDLLTEEEKAAGFKSLFNGKDLEHWIGNKTDYMVQNNEIAVRPENGGHGNLYTAEEYSDFVFRFDFKLTPGANNGLGIHTPLEGDAAYIGKELQILDNTAAIYENLKPYQYHGSVYGVLAAKRGYLNPVGEWNSQEVWVKGNAIKITLNGTVIVDGNMKEASKNGTADGKNHPGLDRNNGHIGFLGHGAPLEFRNIRVKRLEE